MMERDKCLYYREGYEYQVARDYHIRTALIPFAPVKTKFIVLSITGNMVIKAGYAWDGASGPTWDTKNSMIGSMAHDAGYQLIRLGLILPEYKDLLDQMLHALCTEDGMFSWRADYWLWAVNKFGAGSTRPSAEPPEMMAP